MFLLNNGLFVDYSNESCFDKNSLKTLQLLNGKEEKMGKQSKSVVKEFGQKVERGL